MEKRNKTGRPTVGPDNLVNVTPVLENLEARLLMRHTSWGVDPHLVGQDLAVQYFPTLNGRGESIAVIDTGIDYNQAVLGGGTGRGYKVRFGYNFIDNNYDYIDRDGHGTAVAGIIAADPFTFHHHAYQGVAPQAQLLALKVDDGVNNPPASRIRQAIQWVLDHQSKFNIVAVNISEGDSSHHNGKSGGSYSDLLAQCAARGIFVAAAAGNDGWTDGIEYPAADPNVAAVSSVDYSDSVSNFSDTGAGLDLLAPGEDMAAPTLDANGNQTFAYVSGTSFSAPWVTGAAALIKQANPRFSTQQILQTMQDTGTTDTDDASGMEFQRLDLFSALNTANHAARRARAAARGN